MSYVKQQNNSDEKMNEKKSFPRKQDAYHGI